MRRRQWGRGRPVIVALSLGSAFSMSVQVSSAPVAPSVRTQDGVKVLEYPPEALTRAPQWTIAVRPTSTIGGIDADPQYDLTRVSYVVPLSDGRVMTFARIGNSVLVFGRDGRGERVIGKTGQGPGDWMRFGDPVLLAADTVLVLDFANNRLNWVTADKGVVRTAPYTVSGDMRRLSHISGFLATGDLLLHSAAGWGGHQTDHSGRSMANVMLANLTTGAATALEPIPDMQGRVFETRFRGRVRNEPRPLRLGGWATLAAWDSVYASAQASSRSIVLRDAIGTIRARLQPPVKRRAVTKEMREAAIALELSRLAAPGNEGLVDRAESERQAREAPFADSIPYYSQLRTGSDGLLWAVDGTAPGDPGWTATAFRRDGAIVGRLTVNGKSIPMAFGSGHVILRTEDENGVVSLRRHQFVERR